MGATKNHAQDDRLCPPVSPEALLIFSSGAKRWHEQPSHPLLQSFVTPACP